MTEPTRPLPDAATLLADLIRCPTVTPKAESALAYIETLLSGAGFEVKRLTFSEPGTPDVENLFATIGGGSRHLAFNGHADVVPPGDESLWTHPPFAAEVVDGVMYGRGAVDMKSGLACFLAAAIGYVSEKPDFDGRLSLLITGDEEGPAFNGTVKICRWAADNGHRFDAALVGEPTSVKRLGDTIKTGRRGSLSLLLEVQGTQGHVAYPHLADNPVTKLVRLLSRLADIRFDDANDSFEPSNLEITTVDVGNPVVNIIPAQAKARFNIRFNDRWTLATMEDFIRRTLDDAGVPYELSITPLAAEAFNTQSEALIGPLSAAIREVTGLEPKFSTGGGTSDARFLKDYCPVVEFGLVGDTLHQIDERVPVADLDRLTAIYRSFLGRFFGKP